MSTKDTATVAAIRRQLTVLMTSHDVMMNAADEMHEAPAELTRAYANGIRAAITTIQNELPA